MLLIRKPILGELTATSCPTPAGTATSFKQQSLHSQLGEQQQRRRALLLLRIQRRHGNGDVESLGRGGSRGRYIGLVLSRRSRQLPVHRRHRAAGRDADAAPVL